MMNKDDAALRDELQKAQQQADGRVPDFETIFGAAERRSCDQSRDRRRVRFAGLAAAAAVAVLAFGLLPTQENEFRYVDVEELVATTSWSAPSDSLLPVHQFDVYREIPKLFESTGMSTDTDEGALL